MSLLNNNLVNILENYKTNPISCYQRKTLAFPPSFDILSGKILEIVTSIQTELYKTLDGSTSKRKIPFLLYS